MKTFSLKQGQINKQWIVIDAKDAVVGRLAAFISHRLQGKHKPTYTPHMHDGDVVVIINADKICLTGKKTDKKDGKIYYRHTGYMGGIKETTAGKILAGKFPHRVLEKAVERMLKKESVLARAQLRSLFIYSGDQHPHSAQQPVEINFAELNRKNVKSNN
jgi:large subunit ribosomal protein L13